MRTALPGEVNYEPIDNWTWWHVVAGGVLNAVGAPFWAAAVVGVGWELLERPTRIRAVAQSIMPASYAGQDTAENALWDAAATMGGWGLAEAIRKGQRRKRGLDG